MRGLAALRLEPAGDEPLGLLVRLFQAGDELDAEAAAAALAPLRPEELEADGVLEPADAGLRARVRLTPFQDLRSAPVASVTPLGSGSELL